MPALPVGEAELLLEVALAVLLASEEPEELPVAEAEAEATPEPVAEAEAEPEEVEVGRAATVTPSAKHLEE